VASKRSALAVFLAAVVMFFCSTFVAQPWDMAATVAAALCGTAALLLFLVARARSGMHTRI
jgi:hypothetical protein